MKRIIMFFCIMGLALAMSFSYVNADCSVSVSDGNPSVGDSFTATVYYSGTEFGSTDGVLSYDPSILEFTGCSTENGGGGGEVRYSHYQTSGDSSMAVSFYFTVIGSGDGYVSANADTYDVDGNFFSSDSSSSSFTVGGGAASAPETTTEPEETTEPEDATEPETETPEDGGQDSSGTSEGSSQEEESEGTSSEESSEESESSDSQDNDSSSEDENSEESESEENEAENEEKPEEEESEEKPDEENNEEPLYVYYDGISYQVLECKPSDIPAGFTPAVSKYEGSSMRVLKSKDKKILLAYLKNDWAEEDPDFFIYDEVNEFFYPASFEEIGGKKYLVTSSEAKRLYGEDGYYYYDPAYGKAVPEDIDPLITAAKEEAIKAYEADQAKAEQQASEEATKEATKESANNQSEKATEETASSSPSRSVAPMVLLAATSLLLLAVILFQVKLLRNRNK